MNKTIQENIQSVAQEELDLQSDNCHASLTFGGDQLVLTGGTMSAEEWEDFTDEIIEVIREHAGFKYEIHSVHKGGSTLFLT